MKFRTEIPSLSSPFRLTYEKPMLFLGSCFTDNIGLNLKELYFPILINPFGVVYNPLSVKKSLEILIEEKIYTEKDLQHFNGLWYSWDHHSSFSNPEKHEILNKINTEIAEGVQILKKSSFLLITFGTSRVYRLRDTNQIVCNCHKKPASIFNRELLEVDTIVKEYEELYLKISKINPSIRFIFTVSPVRHWKDGAHGNQVSKSILFLALEKIKEIYKDAYDYFPSYEFLMDDLRDYRFYSDDLLHPNGIAIEYIWQKFMESYFDPETKTIIETLGKIIKASRHRVNFPGSKQHNEFSGRQLDQIFELEKKYPFLDLTALKQHFLS